MKGGPYDIELSNTYGSFIRLGMYEIGRTLDIEEEIKTWMNTLYL